MKWSDESSAGIYYIHSAEYIFISFGVIVPILITLKLEYRLSQC